MAMNKRRQTRRNMAKMKKSNAVSDVITASDITIRDFVLSDVVDYMVWTRDYIDNKESGLKYLEKTVIPHPWHKAICLRGCAIGEIKFDQGNAEYMCQGQITYILAKKYWGKGIGTLAVKLGVLKIFREIEKVERIEAVEDLKNVRSQRVLEKVGFLKECVLRKYCWSYKKGAEDMLMYSLLRTDQKECDVLSDITNVFENLQL